MSIIIKITKKIPVGSVLKTPSGRSNFTIYHINSDMVMIQVGKEGRVLSIPSICFEEASHYLRGKGWVRIGAIHDVPIEETFKEFVQRYAHRSAASYVAPILEKIGVVEIDRRRTAKIRFIQDVGDKK